MAKLIWAESTKAEGNMSFAWGERGGVIQNREKFLKKHGLNYQDCVLTFLQGGTEIKVVGKKEKKEEFKCDGLVTTELGVGLFMCAADCLPVIMADVERKVLGLVHLGWRGVDGKLAQKMVQKMMELGADPKKIEVLIGSGVRQETYIKFGKKLEEFQEAVTNKKEWKAFLIEKEIPGQVGVDLVGYVKKQLEEMGVNEEKIQISKIDTIADENYFSHYRAGKTGEEEGRFATVAMLDPRS
jgi:polyphenol oxidase